MPKLGMEKIRRQQLIDATLVSIERHGLHATTIGTISKLAGVSAGIISHYFDGKAGLIEATIKYLLQQLKLDLLSALDDKELNHRERLHAIIDSNFSNTQQSNSAAVTWLAFWAQSMHSPELARLQRVNAARLESNLRYSLKRAIAPEHVDWCAKLLAAQIDGVWLRAALSQNQQEYVEGIENCKRLIEQVLKDYPLS